jgi:hypothetical protein
MAEECKERGWIKTAEEERAAAQVFFNRMAVEEENPKMWTMVERMSLNRDKMALEREKFALKSKEHPEWPGGAKEEDPTGLTPEEKEAAVKQILGIS